jgi:hypothetical protein
MAWNVSLLLTAVLAILILVLVLFLGHQMVDLRGLTQDLRKSVANLGTQVEAVDRLASALQQRVGERPESAAAAPPTVSPDLEGTANAASTPHDDPDAEVPAGTQESSGAPMDAQTTSLAGATRERLAGPKDVYRQLYAEWCANGQRPISTDTVEVAPLRYAGEEPTNEYSPPTPLFEDHRQAGEFVRFSQPGSPEGVAFPNPQAYFNDRAHPVLFPSLTAATYSPQHLANISPVPIRKRGDGKWQKVS